MTITTVLRRLSAIAAAIAVIAATIACSPSLSAQAPATEAPAKAEAAKKDKFDPARFAKEIEKFADLEKALPPSAGGIVFTGSSSIRLWNLKESFPGRPVMNRGFGGSVYRDSVHYVEQLVIKHQPSTVVIYAGDNDLGGGLTPEETAADAEKFVDAVHAKLPETRIIVISAKPSPKRWALADKFRDTNARIAKMASTRDYVKFVDVWPDMLGPDGQPRAELFKEDQLHMNEKGYAIWAKLLDPLL